MLKVDGNPGEHVSWVDTLGPVHLICEIQLIARIVVPEVDDHVVAFSDVHSDCARSINDVSCDGVGVTCIRARIDRNRMLEEIGISGDARHRFNSACRAEASLRSHWAVVGPVERMRNRYFRFA